MTSSNYWQRVQRQRISRRRALAGASMAGLGTAGLALVGCGGGDDGPSTAASDSKLGKPEDTTRQAVPGGTHQDYITTEIQTFDLSRTSNFTAFNTAGWRLYGRLLRYNSGALGEAITSKIEGDLADSHEVSDDGLTWTFRMRPNVKMQPVPPLNGRDLDIDDVRLSWERFFAGSPRRVRFDMVDSVTFPDSRTVVFKNKFPYSPFAPLIADTSSFWIMPKEVAREEVDYRPGGAGTGPFILENYQRGAFLRWKRNPNYFDSPRPYFETVEMPIITEYAQRLAQFRAGNVDVFPPLEPDVLSVFNDVPNATAWQGDFTLSQNYVLFPRSSAPFGGQFGQAGGDVRLRRALSMAFDRDTFIDVFRNVTPIRDAGFQVDVKWDNLLAPGWTFYLDPQDEKEMGYPDKGPGKWYKFDIAEAKKLLSAAGFPNGLDSEIHYSTIWTGDFTRRMEVTRDMWREAGFRFDKLVGHEFQTDYLPNVITKGEFNGVRVGPFTEYTEEDQYWVSAFRPGTDRNPAGWNDPRVLDLIDKQRREFDVEKRKRLNWDLQIYLSDNMYNIPWGGQATSGFTFTQPWVKNYRVYRQVPNLTNYMWLDQTKKS
jgi:peptide/nickel transport system substrate-binding protein